MAVIEIISAEHFDEIVSQNSLVAVDFKADWCGPCRAISPVFQALSGQHTNIVFVSVDVDNVPAVAEKYGVRAMPTFVLLKDGQQVDSLTGANKDGLESKVRAFAA